MIVIPRNFEQFMLLLIKNMYPPCSCSLVLVSPILDCGHTLVGGKKVFQVVCENKGGDGKFCIMRKSCWPTTSFEVRMSMEMEIHERAN